MQVSLRHRIDCNIIAGVAEFFACHCPRSHSGSESLKFGDDVGSALSVEICLAIGDNER